MRRRQTWLDRLVYLGIVVLIVGGAGLFGWAAMTGVVQELSNIHGAPQEIGRPVPWQLNFQLPNSPVQHSLYGFHNFLFGINLAITGLVTALVLCAVWRFRRSRNPEPSLTTHNAPLEVVWTVIPILVLVGIAIPSFRLLAKTNITPEAGLTLKVTGHQWYWDYAYPDHGGFSFSSFMLPEDRIPPDQSELRLLATDQPVVLPVDTVIRVIVTAADVVHAWSVPSLGVKKDAVPGRLNETWALIDREGMYYGQCSELCGRDHAFMPIAIKAVSKEEFAQWVEQARQRFSQRDPASADRLARRDGDQADEH